MLAASGLLGCLVLAFALPVSSVVGGLVVVAAGLAGRSVALARR
jgi:APA family basic amino acid/polyamine antiporter